MVWVYVILRPMFGVSQSLAFVGRMKKKKNTITKINDNVTDAVLRSSKTKQNYTRRIVQSHLSEICMAIVSVLYVLCSHL